MCGPGHRWTGPGAPSGAAPWQQGDGQPGWPTDAGVPRTNGPGRSGGGAGGGPAGGGAPDMTSQDILRGGKGMAQAAARRAAERAAKGRLAGPLISAVGELRVAVAQRETAAAGVPGAGGAGARTCAGRRPRRRRWSPPRTHRWPPPTTASSTWAIRSRARPALAPLDSRPGTSRTPLRAVVRRTAVRPPSCTRAACPLAPTVVRCLWRRPAVFVVRADGPGSLVAGLGRSIGCAGRSAVADDGEPRRALSAARSSAPARPAASAARRTAASAAGGQRPPAPGRAWAESRPAPPGWRAARSTAGGAAGPRLR
jgi:hypothetical protein